MSDFWVELKRGSGGVALTLYEERDGLPVVVDETWWTWDEFLQMDLAPDLDFGGEGPTTVLGGDE